jgi:hypothetical protein
MNAASTGPREDIMQIVVAVVLLALAGPVFVAAPAAAQDLRGVRPNRVVVDYIEPRDPKLDGVYQRIKQRKVLEDYARFLSPLRLPATLRLWGYQCGSPNAYYAPAYRAIHLCYEYVQKFEENAPKAVTPEGFTPTEGVVGAVVSTMLHETGHALRDLLQVPVFGREEDAADQVAGYVALQFGPAVARTVIKGAIWKWLSDARSEVVQGDFADPHSTSQERFLNFLCIGYGGEPEIFKDLAARFLAKSRAAGCAAEYRQIERAFAKTILPSIDTALMQQVRSTKWFTDAELK